MRFRHIAICLLVLLVSINIVLANKVYSPNFIVDYEVVNEKIAIGEEAQYKFTVTNRDSKSNRFRIQNTATDFDLRTSPHYIKLSGQKIFAESDGEEFSVYLLPDEDVKVGQHEVILNVKFESGVVEELPLSVYIEPQSALKDRYSTSLGVDAVFNDEFDPRNEFVMKINLDNLNRRPLDNVIVKVEGNLFNEVKETTIKPLEKGKVITIKHSFDPRLKPQTDTLLITVLADKEIVKTLSKRLEIVDYTSDLTENIVADRALLASTYTLTYTNDGNSPNTQTVTHPVRGLAKIFTSTNPGASIITSPDGDKSFSWELALNPGESTTLKVHTSVQTPVFFLIIIVLAVIYYYYKKSPLVVVKRALRLGKPSDDVAIIKVTIQLKNPSRQVISNVTISDYVPSIAYVINEFKVGTLQPSKILRHESKGDNVIKWELDEIDPHEDRILTYRIKTKLSIIGEIILPAVQVKYRKDKKLVTVKSNSLAVEA